MDKQMQNYKRAPSKAGIEWAPRSWKAKGKVIGWIEQCSSEQKFWKHKGK